MSTAREPHGREAGGRDLLGTPGAALLCPGRSPLETRGPHSALPSPGLQWANVGQAPERLGMTFAAVCWMILFDAALYFACGWYLSSLTPGTYPALRKTAAEREQCVNCRVIVLVCCTYTDGYH